MRAGSARAQQEQAQAGAPVLVCPQGEQLTLCGSYCRLCTRLGDAALSQTRQWDGPSGSKAKSSTAGAGRGKGKVPGVRRESLTERT